MRDLDLFPGKEFEQLIDSHGPDHVTSLMQKVISALEHLERFAGASDAEEATLEDLRATITHLELEEIKKNEEKHRHSKVIIITTIDRLSCGNRLRTPANKKEDKFWMFNQKNIIGNANLKFNGNFFSRALLCP